MRNLRFLAVVLLVAVPCFAKEKLKLEEVLARNLASIGTPEARAAVKSRVAEGRVDMNVIVGGVGSLSGKAELASSGRTSRFIVHFSALEYPGENIFTDGQKIEIAPISPRGRSSLGEFLFRHETILREGLFGGVLGTNWPLLDLSTHTAKLKYEGLKKVEGRELHVVSYVARKQDSSLEIKLYFDPETFRHVMTVYTFEVAPGMSASELEHGTRRYYRLQEEFSNFQLVDGLTLPRVWDIRYSTAPAPGTALEWKVNFTTIADNAVR